MDFDRLRFVSERADSREKLLSVQLPERPGSFLDLYQAVSPRNVTELSYRITAAAAQEGLPWANGQHQGYTGSTEPQAAHVYISYQSRGGSVAAQDEDAREVKADLVASGLEPTDLTDNEMAKAHARYLAGGRAPNVQCERLHRFRAQPGLLLGLLPVADSAVSSVEFPERSGALGLCAATQPFPLSTPASFSRLTSAGERTGS